MLVYIISVLIPTALLLIALHIIPVTFGNAVSLMPNSIIPETMIE